MKRLNRLLKESPMMNQQHFDLVILGSGSTAFAAALRAQEMGKTSVMTEERTVGGTCVIAVPIRVFHISGTILLQPLAERGVRCVQ